MCGGGGRSLGSQDNSKRHKEGKTSHLKYAQLSGPLPPPLEMMYPSLDIY